MDEYQEMCYRLARLMWNTKERPLVSWAADCLNALADLRDMDAAAYREEVGRHVPLKNHLSDSITKRTG